MRVITTLKRFIDLPESTPAAPKPFDDGLVEIARLIAVDDPVKVAPLPDSRMARPGG